MNKGGHKTVHKKEHKVKHKTKHRIRHRIEKREIKHSRDSSPKTITRTTSEMNAEKILVENFVSLQKVMVNLSIKFDGLTGQISKLLELFEISAKGLADKDFSLENENNVQIKEKLDNLLDQNKIIAKGLTLLHEPPEIKSPSPNIPTPINPQQQTSEQPLQQAQTQQAPQTPGQSLQRQGYQRSISSQPQRFRQFPPR